MNFTHEEVFLSHGNNFSPLPLLGLNIGRTWDYVFLENKIYPGLIFFMTS